MSPGIVKHIAVSQRGLEVTRRGQGQRHKRGSVLLEFACIYSIPQKALLLRKRHVCQVSVWKELPHTQALGPGSEVAMDKDSYIL